MLMKTQLLSKYLVLMLAIVVLMITLNCHLLTFLYSSFPHKLSIGPRKYNRNDGCGFQDYILKIPWLPSWSLSFSLSMEASHVVHNSMNSPRGMDLTSPPNRHVSGLRSGFSSPTQAFRKRQPGLTD